jgi:hypothetical protein
MRLKLKWDAAQPMSLEFGGIVAFTSLPELATRSRGTANMEIEA